MTAAFFRDGSRTTVLCRGSDVIRFGGQLGAVATVDRIRDGDPDGYQQLLSSIRVASDDDDDAHKRLVEQIASGALVLVKVDERSRALDAPTIQPLVPRGRPDPRVIEAPTWLSIEVIAEGGVHVPGLGLRVELPDGTERVQRLDGDSRWRADDIPTRGVCLVQLDKIAIDGTTPPGATTVGGTWIDALAPGIVRLSTARHHRLVAVAGRTEINLVDVADQPVRRARCSVAVSGREVSGSTDEDGIFIVSHPRAAQKCVVTFVDYDRSACVPGTS
ncbi:MAG: hypothetical protein JKY37_21935 [Nannocystaceae bacterium]|nr:hypothetical protein [Nannocystaceae bacterium]